MSHDRAPAVAALICADRSVATLPDHEFKQMLVTTWPDLRQDEFDRGWSMAVEISIADAAMERSFARRCPYFNRSGAPE